MAAHLSNDEFFAQLTKLFDASREKGHGSVYLTQKRFTYAAAGEEGSSATKVADDPLWDLHPPNPLPILIRASDGKSKKNRKDKAKLSTVVQPDDLEAFYVKYADVCKSGMTALKKRDRKKDKARKKSKKKAGAEGEKKS